MTSPMSGPDCDAAAASVYVTPSLRGSLSRIGRDFTATRHRSRSLFGALYVDWCTIS
jgi:hypothetical protein